MRRPTLAVEPWRTQVKERMKVNGWCIDDFAVVLDLDPDEVRQVLNDDRTEVDQKTAYTLKRLTSKRREAYVLRRPVARVVRSKMEKEEWTRQRCADVLGWKVTSLNTLLNEGKDRTHLIPHAKAVHIMQRIAGQATPPTPVEIARFKGYRAAEIEVNQTYHRAS